LLVVVGLLFYLTQLQLEPQQAVLVVLAICLQVELVALQLLLTLQVQAVAVVGLLLLVLTHQATQAVLVETVVVAVEPPTIQVHQVLAATA